MTVIISGDTGVDTVGPNTVGSSSNWRLIVRAWA